MEEFLVPMGITKNQLVIDLGVPASRIDQIARGKRSFSADTALRLACYFGNSPEFWLNLQSGFDLRRQNRTAIEQQVRRRPFTMA